MADKRKRPRKERPTPEPADTRTTYGIDRRNFIIVWETSRDAKEATARLAEMSRSLNMPAMPHAIVVARASTLRGEGVELKKHKRGRPAAAVADENELIKQIRAGKKVTLSTGEPVAAPPQEAGPTIEDVMKLLQQVTAKQGK